MREHRKSSHPKTRLCLICNKTFNSRYALYRHTRKAGHKVESKPTLTSETVKLRQYNCIPASSKEQPRFSRIPKLSSKSRPALRSEITVPAKAAVADSKTKSKDTTKTPALSRDKLGVTKKAKTITDAKKAKTTTDAKKAKTADKPYTRTHRGFTKELKLKVLTDLEEDMLLSENLVDVRLWLPKIKLHYEDIVLS